MTDTIRNFHGEQIDYTFHPGTPGATDLVVIATA